MLGARKFAHLEPVLWIVYFGPPRSGSALFVFAKKTLISITFLKLLFDFVIFVDWCKCTGTFKSNKQKNFEEKTHFLLASCQSLTKKAGSEPGSLPKCHGTTTFFGTKRRNIPSIDQPTTMQTNKPIMELTPLSLVSSQMGIIVSSSKRAEKVSEMTGVLLQINIIIKHLHTGTYKLTHFCISATFKKKICYRVNANCTRAL